MEPDTKELKIKTKIEDMMIYAYPALAQFPRGEKYGIVTDIKHIMNEMLGLCIDIEKKRTKKTTIENLDRENTRLKCYLRICHELHFLPTKKYGYWEGLLVEIGKMIGGLLKAEAQTAGHRE